MDKEKDGESVQVGVLVTSGKYSYSSADVIK